MSQTAVDAGRSQETGGWPSLAAASSKNLRCRVNTSCTIDVRDLNTGIASRHGMSSQARRDWRRRRVIDERSKTRKSRERNLVKANQLSETAQVYHHPFKRRLHDCIVAYRVKGSSPAVQSLE